WVDKLKVRVNTGTIGNDDVGGGRWLYNSAYATGGRARLTEKTDGQSPYNFYTTSVVGNPDIHWETAQKTNYGLELDMFRRLVSLSVDYYTQDRTDILLGGTSRAVPPFFGM